MALTVTGEAALAVEALLDQLDARAAAGDVVCARAAAALRRHEGGPGFAPDVMAAAVDRLVQLVREQERQIGVLRAMIETQL